MPLTATLGSFVFQPTESVEAGSDSGWNRELAAARHRILGSARDTITLLNAGSNVRSFLTRMSPSRFAELKALQGTFVVFTDWDLDSRSVWVQTIRREGGSRPFRVLVFVELVEQ